jgi:hypothetical protein
MTVGAPQKSNGHFRRSRKQSLEFHANFAQSVGIGGGNCAAGTLITHFQWTFFIFEE